MNKCEASSLPALPQEYHEVCQASLCSAEGFHGFPWKLAVVW